MNVNSYRPAQSESDQAGLEASNSDVVKNGVDDETIDNELMDASDGQIKNDSDRIYPFSTARSKHSNAVGKNSIAGPSTNRNER